MNRRAAALVVEPDPVVRDELTRRLLIGGLTVTSVFHPRQALEAASFCHFDAAVISQALPEADGITMASRLRRIIADLAVILLIDSRAADQPLPVGMPSVERLVKPTRTAEVPACAAEVETCLERILAFRAGQRCARSSHCAPDVC